MIIIHQKEHRELNGLKIKRNTAAFIGILIFIFTLVFAEEFRKGFSAGLINCAETVIPSLFPFLIAASLAGRNEFSPMVGRYVSRVTEFLFGLPCECLSAIILGQLGGYLSGAKSAQSLCASDRISANQAEKLMLFCVNPGIGFTVNALGSIMLSSRGSGRIIFAAVCISAFICGVISRFLPCEKHNADIKKINSPTLPEAIVGSVSSGTLSILTACAFICLFSGITSVIDAYVTNENIRLAAICLLEITNGCVYASKEMSLPFISAICAFGGLCVHMQIFAVSDNFKIRFLRFYLFRVLHAILAFAVCSLILRLFPDARQVMVNITPEAALWSFSAPASVSMLFLSALLILDLDNIYKVWYD